MKVNFYLLVFIVFCINTSLTAQNCICTGKEEWKENREVLDSNIKKVDPYNSIIKFTVKRWYHFFHDGFSGTGSFIKKNIIVTAKHNIINKGITKITYRIGGKTIVLKKKDFKIFLYKEKSKGVENDIAIIKITNANKYVKNVTFFKYLNNYELNNKRLHLTGFPCDSKGELIEKNALYSTIKINDRNTIIGYPMYTCQGDSGAPLWYKDEEGYFVIGVHHGGNENIIGFVEQKLNVAAFFNKNVISWLNKHSN